MQFIRSFFAHESAGGVLLFVSALLALVFANTGLSHYYDLLIDTPVSVQVGALVIAKPLLLWVNDGLMAFFFLLVGLELKREFMEGELSDKRNIVLPGLGALGGMAAPAAVYTAFNFNDPTAMQGWAIPAATDIAFALGVLVLLGSRVPTSIKVFLTSLAIFDDVGAIIIIAIFYTSKISAAALIVASVCICCLFIMHRLGLREKGPYLFVGLIMWVALLKSGVHATLTGVILAMFIPIRDEKNPGVSPLKSLEHDLHSIVTFCALPIFAFCNAGIAFAGIGKEELLHPISLGIAAGLFVGKQIGVFGFCYLAVVMGLARLPQGMNFKSLYGVSALCGIGFTMSLFIGSLAFEETGANLVFDERLGILIGSLISGLLGYFVLQAALSKEETAENS